MKQPVFNSKILLIFAQKEVCFSSSGAQFVQLSKADSVISMWLHTITNTFT